MFSIDLLVLDERGRIDINGALTAEWVEEGGEEGGIGSGWSEEQRE